MICALPLQHMKTGRRLTIGHNRNYAAFVGIRHGMFVVIIFAFIQNVMTSLLLLRNRFFIIFTVIPNVIVINRLNFLTVKSL
jgi:hypothetical protein